MAKITWTEEAEGWLKDIHDYIAKDNPLAAGKVVAGIYRRAHVVARFPEIGYRYRKEPEGDIRILLYGHYRIAYLIKEADGEIAILGVFHAALDVDRYLS
jgi:toxin ParE1/3/4